MKEDILVGLNSHVLIFAFDNASFVTGHEEHEAITMREGSRTVWVYEDVAREGTIIFATTPANLSGAILCSEGSNIGLHHPLSLSLRIQWQGLLRLLVHSYVSSLVSCDHLARER